MKCHYYSSINQKCLFLIASIFLISFKISLCEKDKVKTIKYYDDDFNYIGLKAATTSPVSDPH